MWYHSTKSSQRVGQQSEQQQEYNNNDEEKKEEKYAEREMNEDDSEEEQTERIIVWEVGFDLLCELEKKSVSIKNDSLCLFLSEEFNP